MKSSFSRNFTTAAAILLLALTILGASFQFQVKEFLEDSTISHLVQDAGVISDLASAYIAGGDLSNQDFLLNLNVVSKVTNADAVICDGDGYIILCSDALAGCQHQGLQLNREYLEKVYYNGSDTSVGVIEGLYAEERYIVSFPIVSQDVNQGLVIVSYPTRVTTQTLSRISNIFLTAAIFVVLISVLAVMAFARRETKPLRDMAKAANAFAHGNLKARVRVEEDYSEEVEELALAFNNMASSLQKSEYRRYVDGILDGTIPPERRDHYLHIVSDETKRLSRLVRSMLDISQLQKEQGIPEDKKVHFDLEECAGQVLITFEKKINDKHLNVDVNFPEHPVYTMANRDYITQVIYNLIDNAVKFCPEGGTLGLKIREGSDKAYVSVSNDGETIPPEELSLVFDRFHKLDKSRSQNRDGWGLGLYIVKTIVCSHGENISVTSKDGKTEFTFTMPLIT